MSSLCLYGNCHNLGSSSYQGYCNKDHFERSFEYDILMDIIKKNKDIATLKQAREFLNASSSQTRPKDSNPPPTKESP